MMVPSALAFDDPAVDVLASKFTMASWSTLCIPKNRNIAKLSRIICCVGGSDPKKVEPKPASLLEGLALAPACVVAVTDGEGFTRGSLISVSSSSGANDALPSSISSCRRSFSIIWGGIIVVCM